MFQISLTCDSTVGAIGKITYEFMCEKINIFDMNFTTRARSSFFSTRRWGEGFVIVDDESARKAFQALQTLRHAPPVGIGARDILGVFLLDVYVDDRPVALHPVLQKLATAGTNMHLIRKVSSQNGKGRFALGFLDLREYADATELLRQWLFP